MFQDLFKKIAIGALRHFLTGLGGSLVASGYITADQDNQGVGAVLLLIGIAWSAYEKVKDHKVSPAPVAVNPNSDTTGAIVKDAPVEVHVLPPINQ